MSVEPMHSPRSPYGEPLDDEQFAIVGMLLKQGANPNAFIAGWNRTVLGHAASRGDLRTAKLLLRHGANVHARMGDGSTALAEARARRAPKPTRSSRCSSHARSGLRRPTSGAKSRCTRPRAAATPG